LDHFTLKGKSSDKIVHKPAKEAIAIIATPTKSVPPAIRVAEGLVRATKTIKRPSRIRTSAERKTEPDFLVVRISTPPRPPKPHH
jgi:hypothetical protein